MNVIKYYQDMESTLIEAAKAAKVEPIKLLNRIEHLNEEVKALSGENSELYL